MIFGRKKQKVDPAQDLLDTQSVRPMERHDFCMIGVIPAEVTEMAGRFATAPYDELHEVMMQEAGLPMAKAFESTWQQSEQDARRRGLFDLAWRRRAMEYEPVVNIPIIMGFDALIAIAKDGEPELSELLGRVDGNDPGNPRRTQGPSWWENWHEANGSRPGGWLDQGEVEDLNRRFGEFANPEIEEACLTLMGTPYTHPGCWELMTQLKDFLEKCAADKRSIVAEVDL